MNRFETHRIIVEDLRRTDFPALLKIYNKKENMKFISSGKYEWSEEELKEKLEPQMKNYPFGYGIFGIKIKPTMEESPCSLAAPDCPADNQARQLTLFLH